MLLRGEEGIWRKTRRSDDHERRFEE